MAYLEKDAEYKDLLDECERSSSDEAERQEGTSASSYKKVISGRLCNPWIYHLALALSYSLVLLFIFMKYLPDHSHGPNLIYCKPLQTPSNDLAP